MEWYLFVTLFVWVAFLGVILVLHSNGWLKPKATIQYAAQRLDPSILSGSASTQDDEIVLTSEAQDEGSCHWDGPTIQGDWTMEATFLLMDNPTTASGLLWVHMFDETIQLNVHLAPGLSRHWQLLVHGTEMASGTVPPTAACPVRLHTHTTHQVTLLTISIASCVKRVVLRSFQGSVAGPFTGSFTGSLSGSLACGAVVHASPQTILLRDVYLVPN